MRVGQVSLALMAAVALLFVPGAAGVAVQPEPGGYGPNEQAAAPVPGGFRAVVTARTIGQDGAASLSGTVQGGAVAVEAPRGAIPAGSQVRVTTASTPDVTTGLTRVGFAGHRAVATTGVNVYNADGTKYTGTFASPVAVTITSPEIKPGDFVVRLDSMTAASRVPATVTNGSASFTIAEDPYLAVLSGGAGAGQAIPGATEVKTGGRYSVAELTALTVVLIGAMIAATGVVVRRRSARTR